MRVEKTADGSIRKGLSQLNPYGLKWLAENVQFWHGPFRMSPAGELQTCFRLLVIPICRLFHIYNQADSNCRLFRIIQVQKTI